MLRMIYPLFKNVQYVCLDIKLVNPMIMELYLVLLYLHVLQQNSKLKMKMVHIVNNAPMQSQVVLPVNKVILKILQHQFVLLVKEDLIQILVDKAVIQMILHAQHKQEHIHLILMEKFYVFLALVELLLVQLI